LWDGLNQIVCPQFISITERLELPAQRQMDPMIAKEPAPTPVGRESSRSEPRAREQLGRGNLPQREGGGVMTVGVALRRWPAVEQTRFQSVIRAFAAMRSVLVEPILDFGASSGLSMIALHTTGLTDVHGVEPVKWRVDSGHRILGEMGMDPSRLLWVEDTRKLPYPDGRFGTVLANAVLEHIPQPRAAYIRELWRVLAVGGHLVISETPNKYLPLDYHTTHLWGVPWLPKRLSRAYAIWRGRYDTKRDWHHSGWRGLGYYELVQPLKSYKLIPENSSPRHRWLTRLGLPASLFDPYPCWILQKIAS
jgi:SAM-dependent methyltransferase